jgi:hypothetical protein
MKQNKSKFHLRISNEHLHDMMQTGISNMEPNVNFVMEQMPKFHINKVSLGCFYCNVQFCVGYSRDILNASALVAYIFWCGPPA